MHILQITICFRTRAAYTRGVIPKTWFIVLEEYQFMHSEKLCAIVRDISDVLTCTMRSSCKKISCEKNFNYMCKRVHFWHRSRLRHDLLQWDALPFWKNALVEGNTHLKEMHHSFSRESFKVFEYVLTQGLSQQCQYDIQVYTFVRCLCFCICSTQFRKHI